jgi:hypothetical protein
VDGVFRSFVLDLAAVPADGTLDTADLAFPEATLGDLVEVSPGPALEANLVIGGAWVQSAGQVRFRLGNLTAAPIDPASRTYFLKLSKKGQTL